MERSFFIAVTKLLMKYPLLQRINETINSQHESEVIDINQEYKSSLIKMSR